MVTMEEIVPRSQLYCNFPSKVNGTTCLQTNGIHLQVQVAELKDCYIHTE